MELTISHSGIAFGRSGQVRRIHLEHRTATSVTVLVLGSACQGAELALAEVCAGVVNRCTRNIAVTCSIQLAL